MTKMRALVFNGARDFQVHEIPRPVAGPGRAIVDVAYTGICGTDLHIWSGHHPRARAGLVIGHEFVGRLSSPLDSLAAGTPVFVNPLLPCGKCPACRYGADQVCTTLRLLGIDAPGGAAEQVAVAAEALVPLPQDVDLLAAALIEPMAVCIRAVRRSGQFFGSRVHVTGAGPIGLLVAMCARAAGAATLTLSELSRERAETARRLGFEVVSAEPEPVYDIVYDCTGHPAVAPEVLGWAVTGGTIVDVGMYPGPVTVDLADLMRRELRIIGTCVYRPSDVLAAVGLVTANRIPVGELVTSVVSLADASRAFDLLSTGSQIKVLISSTG